MNTEINDTAEALHQTFVAKCATLKSKSDEELRDLLHHCMERNTEDRWTVRTACELNEAAALSLLDERQ